MTSMPDGISITREPGETKIIVEPIRTLLNLGIEQAHKELAKFADKMTTDDHHGPLSAFEWGAKAFESAAILSVFTQAKNAIEEGTSLEHVYEYAMSQALRGARSPKRSTSPLANLADEFTTMAWAKLVDRLER